MKKIGLVVCVALFAVGFPFQGGAFTMGDINSDNRIDMTEAIHALQVVSDVRTAASAGATINVPTEIPTIQAAIDAAAPGDTINVAAGAYTAALTIKNKSLTIRGAGAGTTTITGISGADVLAIDQCRGVIVSGVTLTGGENGIIATRGSVLEVADAVVRNTTKKGILIQENSTARLKNVSIEASGHDGIKVFLSSSVIFSGAVSSNDNVRDGINIMDGSSASFSDANVIVNQNAGKGVGIRINSGLLLDNSSLAVTNGKGTASNSGRGIQALTSSSIMLTNNSSIHVENNQFDGIGVGPSSNLTIGDSTCSLTVTGSERYGIIAMFGSGLYMDGTTVVQGNGNGGIVLTDSSNLYLNGELTVENNQGTGIYIGHSSQASLFPNAPKAVAVKNNAYGIVVSDGSGITGNGATFVVTPNTNKDIQVTYGSRASVPLGSYSTISCSQSYNTMGVPCP